MFLQDRVSVGSPRRTADGYLVADAKVARTGIQEYLGVELGRPDMPVIRVYRPPEEVFAKDAMHSYAYRPVTVDHPSKMVDAESWRAVAAGQTGGEVVRDGEFVRVPLVLMDAKAIKAWESGKRELSMGYTSEIVFLDGVTPDGQQYDAVQTQLRMNHLALVDRARGGAALRIGDDTPNRKDQPMSDIKTKTVLVDGLSVETTDAGAQAIEKLQRTIADRDAKLAQATTDHAAALAAKDEQIGTLKAELQKAQDAALKPADIDRMVADRAALVATAKVLAPALKVDGIGDADIRKAVVAVKLGDEAVKDASDAEISGMFRVLAKDARPADPVRDALMGGTGPTPVADNGYAASVAGLDYRTRNAQKEG